MIDSLVFSILLTLPLGLILPLSEHLTVRIMIVIGVGGMILLFRRRHTETVRRKAEAEKERQDRYHAFLMSDDQTISEIIGQPGFHLIRKEHPDRFDVFDAIRSNVNSIGLCSRNKELSNLIKTSRPDIKIYFMNDLFKTVCSGNEKGENRLIGFLRSYPFNKYIMLGLIFLFASFLFRYKIYFRLISCICLILAPISDIFGDRSMLKKLRIFLDNKGNR